MARPRRKNLKRVNKSFKFGQCPKRFEYVNFVNQKLKPFSYEVKFEKPTINIYKKTGQSIKGTGKFYFYTSALPVFAELRKDWYTELNKKIVPKNLVLNWQIVSHWYADDGNNYCKSIIICTDGFEISEVKFLINCLKRDLNIEGILFLKNRIYPRIRIKSKDYVKFLGCVKVYLGNLNCLKDKFLVTDYKKSKERIYRPKNLIDRQLLEIIDLYENSNMTIKQIADKFNIKLLSLERFIYSNNGSKLRRNKIKR